MHKSSKFFDWKTFSAEKMEELYCQIESWAQKWTVRFANSFNNSCHIMWRHVPDYLRKYHNIYMFSQQGVEGLVKLVKRTNNLGVCSSAELSSNYMVVEGWCVLRVWDTAKQMMQTKCHSCGKIGHSRRSSKLCVYYKNN